MSTFRGKNISCQANRKRDSTRRNVVVVFIYLFIFLALEISFEVYP